MFWPEIKGIESGVRASDDDDDDDDLINSYGKMALLGCSRWMH